ncbi:MAG: hypothetical protein K0S47_3912 [Herbinix sp.]|jgi:HD-GYP domain-containing protein (c-di-GMP phosphodiesterase class II)|nr:hypothetical protein [Herbinix sp.]
MRIISLDAIKGTEILAKDIINDSNSVLMLKGSVIKKEYVRRLKDLNINYIYVDDEVAKGVDLSESLELQIKEQCQDIVKDILLRYSFQTDNDLKEIKKVADDVIYDVLNKPEVLYNLSSIRDKSESTYSHSLNVCALSVILALKLKLNKAKIKEIAIGSLLHDIGFTYISMDYSQLTYEGCTEKQQRELKKHIIYGFSAVEKMDWLSATAKEIILSHHERLDGSGYPFHLKGDRIKIGSKIVAVCDDFDSRVYGNLTTKMKVHDAIDFIVGQADLKYDINVVKVFVDSVAAYPTGTIVITSENETGIVLRQNVKCPTRPVIRIIKNNKGVTYKDWLEKDLTKELTLFITDTVID